MEEGKPKFAVISYEDFNAAFRSNGPTIPEEVVFEQMENGNNLIKAWRKYLKLTQGDIAKRIKVSQAAYSKIENGKPSKEQYQKIAKAMKLDVRQLDLDLA